MDDKFEYCQHLHLLPLSIILTQKQNYTAEVNCLVALHELYKYINKYYDQVSITLEYSSFPLVLQ